NTPLAEKKPHWIDFNAGRLIEGMSMEAMLEDFVDHIVAIASGELTNNEKNDFRELAIFKSGVTL
ncbi:altronate hydrolase, partial [Pantoea graminicola]